MGEFVQGRLGDGPYPVGRAENEKSQGGGMACDIKLKEGFLSDEAGGVGKSKEGLKRIFKVERMNRLVSVVELEFKGGDFRTNLLIDERPFMEGSVGNQPLESRRDERSELVGEMKEDGREWRDKEGT